LTKNSFVLRWRTLSSRVPFGYDEEAPLKHQKGIKITFSRKEQSASRIF